MDGIKVITHEEIRTSKDDFYREFSESINQAQRLWGDPSLGCDWLRSADAFDVFIFPLQIYRKMEEANGHPRS